MEVSALKPTPLAGLRGASPLLRLQSDERLIALTRRGQHAAFETLFARYQARLLAFCRHMLSSREDAEDVLQEVFTAAFNAILADEREINVRPWLYRIARNRSLNHLRKASAIGVDSMDVHYADNGISTTDKVLRRERFKQLIADVQQLPETQRTALLLREIDALSYEQISEAMETTIPSVKSLLVRARISLAEAAESRELSCEDVRVQLGESAEGIAKMSAAARRHMRTCDRCRSFRKRLKANNVALAAVMPVGGFLFVKKVLSSKLGAGAHVAGGAGAGASAAAGTGGAAGGIATAGAGAIASKAVAGLAAAALVTAGAVEAEHATSHPPVRHPAVTESAAPTVQPPAVVRSTAQRPSAAEPSSAITSSHHEATVSGSGRPGRSGKATAAASTSTTSTSSTKSTTSTTTSSSTSEAEAATSTATTGSSSTLGAEASDVTRPGGAPPTTEVVTETTKLPGEAETSSTEVSASSPVTSSSTSTSSGTSTASSTSTSTTSHQTGTTGSVSGAEEPGTVGVTGGTPATGAASSGG